MYFYIAIWAVCVKCPSHRWQKETWGWEQQDWHCGKRSEDTWQLGRYFTSQWQQRIYITLQLIRCMDKYILCHEVVVVAVEFNFRRQSLQPRADLPGSPASICTKQATTTKTLQVIQEIYNYWTHIELDSIYSVHKNKKQRKNKTKSKK